MKKNASTTYMVLSIILLTPSLVLRPQNKVLQGLLFIMAIASLVTGIIAVKINKEYMRAKEFEEMEQAEKLNKK